MGGTSSLLATPEDARARLGVEECVRLSAAFDRLADADGTISQLVFLSHVISELAPTMPRTLAASIFRAFHRSQSNGVTRDELLVAVATIRTGSREEQLELAFHAANASQSGRLTRHELVAYMDLLEGREALGDVRSGVNHLFSKRDEVTARELSDWIFTVTPPWGVALCEWMPRLCRALGGSQFGGPSPMVVSSPVCTSVRSSPMVTPLGSPHVSPMVRARRGSGSFSSPYTTSSLVGQERHALDFSAEDLGTLKALFLKCKGMSTSGAVDLAALKLTFGSSLPPTLLAALFDHLDEDGKGPLICQSWLPDWRAALEAISRTSCLSSFPSFPTMGILTKQVLSDYSRACAALKISRASRTLLL